MNEKYNVIHSGTIIQASNNVTLGRSMNRASVRELVVVITVTLKKPILFTHY